MSGWTIFAFGLGWIAGWIVCACFVVGEDRG